MAVDNPFYFSMQNADSSSNASNTSSINSPQHSTRTFGGFFRRNRTATNKTGSAASVVRPVPMLADSSQPRSTISNTASRRKNFRNLFRSASASADCEKTIQFLKGDPRPSDVAPPSPCLNNRSHTFSEGRFKSSRRRNLKSTSELLNMDMVFCGLPTENAGGVPNILPRRTEDNDYYSFDRDSECGSEATTLPLDELEDERSYYNFSATLPHSGRLSSYSSMGKQKYALPSSAGSQPRRTRRHSVGTFLDQDSRNQMARSTNLVVEPTATISDVVDHANECSMLIRSNIHEKFGTRHVSTTFGAKPSEIQTPLSIRDDVVFISSKDNEASTLWVNYLTACFEQISRQQGRPPFKVAQVAFEEPITPDTDLKIRNSRLQIIVVCPVFLERVLERPEQAMTITRQLNAERVLAMMLGVQDSHLSANQRAHLVAYANWRKFFVKDQDETFVGQFLGAAVAILGSIQANNLNKGDKTVFSIHPKKVKMGQNRILALLNDPLHPDDNVTVLVDRCGEAIEVNHVKRRNPYVLQFSIPERCLDVSMLVGVRISRNGTPLGVRQVKCESRLRELDQILRAHDNPLEFMCQTFGFNPGDKEQLDNWMVHAFQKNVPPHFNLLSNQQGDLQLSKNHSSSEENPTLLHFAARFGLEKLAWQLLECPGGDIACDMRNVNDMTPADLAEQAGQIKLAHQLRGYMQMNEFSNMYSYLKVMSENTQGNMNGFRAPSHQSTRSDDDFSSRQEDYCRPRPISDAYAVPPTARPVFPMCTSSASSCRTFPDYSTPPPLPQPNPVTTTMDSEDNNMSTPTSMPLTAYSSSSTLNVSNMELPFQGYMQMNPAGLRLSDSISTTTLTSSQQLNQIPHPEIRTPGTSETSKNEGVGEQVISTKSNRSSQSSNKSRESPQDELLEIINDFKNNVFTISEVERLVENWRNRNDVQQSFKDKQKQLSAMRDEYERIQKRIKDELKAPTPFDRIRKFFTKGKKDSKDSGSGSEEAASVNKPIGISNSNLANHRPISSLSLHSVSSSSSSGRMSTASGCSGTSLGDSGTHSDTDDRRHTTSEEKATGITSYEIPPAPKPFNVARLYSNQPQTPTGSRYTPTQNRSMIGCTSVCNSELDLQPVKSSASVVDDKEYYIAFPPCGLPVHLFKCREVKTPSTPIDTSREFLDRTEEKNEFNRNYANVGPILTPPPGMCKPFEYMNVVPGSGSRRSESKVKTTKEEGESDNVLTIRPDIHPQPDESASDSNTTNENEKISEVQKSARQLASPKILNTDSEDARTIKNMPDYTNVQVAASEEIARNFGVTLKKLPAPPVPPRSEFNFSNAQLGNDTTANANE